MDGDRNVAAGRVAGTFALDSILLAGTKVVPVGDGSIILSLSSSSVFANIVACCSMTSASSGRMHSPLLSLDPAEGICAASCALRRLAMDAAAAR